MPARRSDDAYHNCPSSLETDRNTAVRAILAEVCLCRHVTRASHAHAYDYGCVKAWCGETDRKFVIARDRDRHVIAPTQDRTKARRRSPAASPALLPRQAAFP